MGGGGDVIICQTLIICFFKVTDNGVPALENTLDVKIEFVYEQLICTVPDEPFLVHLDPMPSTTISLGQIQCTANGETQTPEFEIMS